MVALFAIVLSAVNIAEASWGSSERQKDLEQLDMAGFEEMVTDTEHIKEEFEEIFSEDDLKAMNHDELAFAWFSAHDSDADESLDGLELLKAVLHAHHEVHEHEGAKAGYADEQRGGDTDTAAAVSEETFAEVEGFIDDLLIHYDVDGNGLLDFPEFMISFGDHQERLKGKKPS